MRAVTNWIFAMFAFAMASAAQAQSWIDLGPTADGNHPYYDLSSIRYDDGHLSVWVMMNYAKPQVNASVSRYYITEKMRWIYDCDASKFGLSADIEFDVTGNVAFSSEYRDGSRELVDIKSGSLVAQIHDRICYGWMRYENMSPLSKAGPYSQNNSWKMVAKAKDLTEFYIDMANMSYSSDRSSVFYFLKYVGNGEDKFPDGTPYKYQYGIYSIDCHAHNISGYISDYYDQAGKLVGQYKQNPGAQQPASISPGSVSSMEEVALCQDGQQKSEDTSASSGGAAQYSSGTAWLGPRGYLITAYHVIENANEIGLAQNGKPVGTAAVVVADPANDIAILKATFANGNHASLPLSETPSSLGEKVFTLGYPAPDKLGLAIKMTSGEVSALTGNDVASQRHDDARLLQISIPVQSGNSGGPVIDDGGHVIGMVLSKTDMMSQDEIAQNVNYAIKIGYVRNLLADLPVLPGYHVAKAEPTFTGRVGAFQDGVFLLIATVGPSH